MHKIINPTRLSFFVVMLGVLLCTPFSLTHAKTNFLSLLEKKELTTVSTVTNDSSKIQYHNVTLSDLNPEIIGDLRHAKIMVPASIDNTYVPEIDASFRVTVYSEDEIWLDKNENFSFLNPDTNKPTRLFGLKKLGGVNITKTKKGFFQGSYAGKIGSNAHKKRENTSILTERASFLFRKLNI